MSDSILDSYGDIIVSMACVMFACAIIGACIVSFTGLANALLNSILFR